MAFEVICIRSVGSGIPPPVSRSARAFEIERQHSKLDKLLENGLAELVFGPRERNMMGARNRGFELPEFIAVRAKDEHEARDLLESLQNDQPEATVYVAPPRHVLSRGSGSRASAATTKPSHWGMASLGITSPSIDASSIVVAVVDTGVDRTHPDLVDAIDDYVNFTQDSDKDLDGHGTHVCGIIAATGNPAVGMQGVSNARLLVFKGLGKRYSPSSYYRALGAACSRARIVNLSLGGTHSDPGEQVIIERALRSGVIVVAAMGNDGDNGNADNYPAALPGVLAVGAVDSTLSPAEFSNTGAHISLVAPGVDIWSTVPTYHTGLFASTSYAPCDGTSMAAPFVAGVVALLAASTNGNWNADDVRDRIPVMHCPGQSCRMDELGAGVLHWPGPLNLGTA